MVFTAFAVVYPDIKAKTTRIGTLATPDSSTAATQGLSVTASGTNKRLFVVQINGQNNKAILYMYKDYTAMTNSSDDEYGTFVLSDFVGHANAMAIDNNYIYIACWNGKTNENGQKIARISRNMLWKKYKSTTSTNKGTLTANSDGVTIMSAEYSNGTPYNYDIVSMTYYKNGKFIVNRGVRRPSEADYFQYTTAEISGDKFIVSNSAIDKFEVSFETKGTTAQDIGYDSDCGFFVVRYLGGAKNSIIWVKLNSLTGENRVYKKDNSKYRVITVNKSSNIFDAYELESVSIGMDNHLYANVNTKVIDGKESIYPGFVKDAIIRIERPQAVNDNTKFLGTTITE